MTRSVLSGLTLQCCNTTRLYVARCTRVSLSSDPTLIPVFLASRCSFRPLFHALTDAKQQYMQLQTLPDHFNKSNKGAYVSL